MDQTNIKGRWAVRFRYLQHVWCPGHDGLQTLFRQSCLLPTRRYHLCHAFWILGWSSIIFVHCRQVFSKDQYSGCLYFLGDWIDVSSLQSIHVVLKADLVNSIQYASVNIGMLVVGRVVAGLCVGIASSICPVYQAEIAPKEIHGELSLCNSGPSPGAFSSNILSNTVLRMSMADQTTQPNRHRLSEFHGASRSFQPSSSSLECFLAKIS